MSYQASRENCHKNKKQLRQEAIDKSKTLDVETRRSKTIEFLIPDPDYNVTRNVLDSIPGGLM